MVSPEVTSLSETINPNELLVARALFEHPKYPGELVMVLDDETGLWEFPGGKLWIPEYNDGKEESREDATIRETAQETGHILKVDNNWKELDNRLIIDGKKYHGRRLRVFFTEAKAIGYLKSLKTDKCDVMHASPEDYLNNIDMANSSLKALVAFCIAQNIEPDSAFAA